MEFLSQLGIKPDNSGSSTGSHWLDTGGDEIRSCSPVDGNLIARVYTTTDKGYEDIVHRAGEAFAAWRNWPAPKRGEVVRQIPNEVVIKLAKGLDNFKGAIHNKQV